MSAKRSVIRAVAEVPAAPVDRSPRATIQVLLGPEQQAPNFVLRRFTMEPGGRIPAHLHDAVEHVQYVLEGEMVVTLDGEEHRVVPGDSLLIPAGVPHAYENRGQVPVRFLCIVPRTDLYRTAWME